jgi:hypothetical protein
MTSDEERCAEYERFKKIHAAFKAGDLEALREAVEDPVVSPPIGTSGPPHLIQNLWVGAFCVPH